MAVASARKACRDAMHEFVCGGLWCFPSLNGEAGLRTRELRIEHAFPMPRVRGLPMGYPHSDLYRAPSRLPLRGQSRVRGWKQTHPLT